MPGESINADSQRLGELDRRVEQLERENRWWRGGLIAALVLFALVLLSGGRRHHRIDVTVNAPPWAWRGPYCGWGPVPYAVPQRGAPGHPGEVPGGGPNPPAPQSPPG